ncbi:MAG: phosphoenolpyruvate--protein phosphotransferase [Myxococcota bacterium]
MVKKPPAGSARGPEDTASEGEGLVRRKLTGIGVSPGVAIGNAYLLDRAHLHFPKRHVTAQEVDAELAKLDQALAKSVNQLQEMADRVKGPLGEDHSLILQAHILMLKDPHLVDVARDAIRKDHQNAEWALRRAVATVKQTFDSLSDEYFRERRSDVDFVGDRVLRNLMGQQADVPESLPKDAIVVARDLSPADTLSLARQQLRGFVTEVGGPTSHTAILARALSIPAVVGVEGVSELLGSGDALIVDGSRGEVLIAPSRMVVAKYRGIRRQHELANEELSALRDAPAVTLDGRLIRMTANIELDEEIPHAMAAGAEGVGLYRTEYLFLHHRRVPTVEEHTESYTAVAQGMGGKPAVVRTFDLGGDKLLPGGQLLAEHSNALGLRAIRLAVKEPLVMLTQLEGILRASAHGPLRIMLPMVGSVEELRQAKLMIDECKEKLRVAGVPFDERIPVGMMIELPSAVWVAEHLAKECDFFSIGTNDLIQYSLAVDRHNEHVAHLYQPLHPGILRALHHTVTAAHAAGIRVSMCGEMAAEAAYAGVLLGLGLDELSMPAMAIPRVKHTIRHWKQTDAVRLVKELLECATAKDVEVLLVSNQPEVELHPMALKPSVAPAGSA